VDVGEMQRKLSQWATEDKERKFRDLYSLLCNEIWLRVAHKSVSSNAGRETAGIDGVTMSNFNGNLDRHLGELKADLKARIFEPLPVDRAYVPKPNGKLRPLGIPAIKDRIVQEALRMALEPIWEADFSIHSYGFRPNRSTYDAIAYIGNRLTGQGRSYQWIIEGDITSYFDTIPHRRLIKMVKRRIADKDIRNLLWKFLRAGVMEKGQLQDTLTGTPQGGIISPLLANLYLHDLDVYMESKYLTLTNWYKGQRRAQGKSNFLYVRYADDFVVLCNGTKTQAQAMKEELGGLLSTMGLKLSEEKTRITHITEGFDFLGYRVIRSIGTRGIMVPKVLIPDKAIKRFQDAITGILNPNTHNDSVNAKIVALNRVIRGWCQYYRNTSSPIDIFGDLHNFLYWKMAHWLGRKYEMSIKKIMKRFWKDKTYRTKSQILVMPGSFKANKLMVRHWYNPYTVKGSIKRELIFSYETLWTGHERRQGSMDKREEVLLRDGPICAACKGTFHESEVHADHIVLRAKFKDPLEADHLDNYQILCNNCHRAKTESDLKTLSRMRRRVACTVLAGGMRKRV
jgi:RNA-directed DNA polymerase